MKKFKIPKVELFGIDLIKNFLLFATFIIIFLLLLATLVAPSIKKFKKVKRNYYITQINYSKSEEELAKILTKYKDTSKENRKIILSLKRDFDTTNFKHFANNYMNILNIKEKNTSVYNKSFIKTTYVVTAKLKSPDNFYQFVKTSKNYKNILKIYFPIVFKSSKKEILLLYKLEAFKVLK